jgi:hypothetical protein
MQHDVTLRDEPQGPQRGPEQSADQSRAHRLEQLAIVLNSRAREQNLKREVDVDEQHNNVWTSVTLMALVGGVITALLYTDRGRQSLQRMEDALDNFAGSLQQLRGTIQKAGLVAAQGIDVASESVEVVSHLIGKGQGRQGSASLH